MYHNADVSTDALAALADECIAERRNHLRRKLRREIEKDGTTEQAAESFRRTYERGMAQPFTGCCRCETCRRYREEQGIPQPEAICTWCVVHRNQGVVLNDGNTCPSCGWQKGQPIFAPRPIRSAF